MKNRCTGTFRLVGPVTCTARAELEGGTTGLISLSSRTRTVQRRTHERPMNNGELLDMDPPMDPPMDPSTRAVMSRLESYGERFAALVRACSATSMTADGK